MALYKRPNSRNWWVRFTAPDGRQIRESTQTADRKAAQEYEDRRKAELWRQQRLGERPRYLWQQAVERWLVESAGNASLEDAKMHLRWLHVHLYDMCLDTIDRDVLDQITKQRLEDGVSNATVNRLLEVVRAILRRARDDWQWLNRTPSVRMLPEAKRRIRWLTREEADRLLQALPAHLAAMARFSLATGLREKNVTRLEWSQVDLARRMAWVHPDQSKARKPIAVPLNREAVLVLRGEQGKHSLWVFTYRGQPVNKANTRAWRRALNRAGIEDFRWHDLRHTWASWHVQNGTPLHVLQELGGWSCYSMVQRYAHLSAQHLAEYVDNIAPMGVVPSTLLGTQTKEDKEKAAG